MSVTGTSRISYKPGEKVAESLPAEAGVYDLNLVDIGKRGRQGWTAKPGKFHSRRIVLELLGTEDEVSGLPKKVYEYVSLSPKALFRILLLAQAAGYPEELELTNGYDKPNAPGVLSNADAVDVLLEWIKSNNVALKAAIIVDEYNGRENNKVGRYLAADDTGDAAVGDDATEGEGDAAEEAGTLEAVSEDATEEEVEKLEEAPEEEEVAEPEEVKVPAPRRAQEKLMQAKPAAKKPAPAPSRVVQPGQKKPATKKK